MSVPDLSTPDESGGDNMLIRELRVRLTTSTPREGTKREKPGGRWEAAGRSLRAAAARWAAAARRLLTARGAGGRWSAAGGHPAPGRTTFKIKFAKMVSTRGCCFQSAEMHPSQKYVSLWMQINSNASVC